MAGHSKWANIKHRKNKQDAVKGKIFTKLIREITVAARHGSDPTFNAQLRLALDKAFAQNMSRDTIDRAIKRGSGAEGENKMEAITYEGYATHGVALLVSCLTDNRNRTVGDVRHLFTKYGGNLGTTGSVAYLFKQHGLLLVTEVTDESQLMQLAIDYGAEDLITHDDGSIEIITAANQLIELKNHLTKQQIIVSMAEIVMIASTRITLNREASLQLIALTDALEELDDVQQTYHNAELDPSCY